jgi:hypothetical protein
MFQVATVQVETWLATYKGSIDHVSEAVDTSLADAALARMMLHRRRAAVAEVIDEFFAGVGTRFGPYLQGRAPQAPHDVKAERATAAAAGAIVAGVCGAAPPLLFERALLADMEGRDADALADLELLLDSFPGFVAAAVVAGRLAMAAGDPGRAIGWLAYVESELAATREGSALLADALRAVELHASASNYDLAASLCLGYADSRGNDCAPVDLKGNVAHDQRMPPPAVAATNRSDGRLLCNDRGVYYLASSRLGLLIFEATGGVRLISSMRPLKPADAGRHPATGGAKAAARSGRRQLANIGASLTAAPRIPATGARAGLRRIFIVIRRLLWRVLRRLLAFLYSRHKEWAFTIFLTLNRYVPSPLRYWEFSLIEIPERDRRSAVARVRLQSGIARIFRTAPECLYSAGGEALQSAQLPAPAAAVLSQLTGEQ